MIEERNDKVSSGTNYKQWFSRHNDVFKPICVQNIIIKICVVHA